MTPQYVLENVFGFTSFRDPQENICNHVTNGGDAMVLLPTGKGKSLCYMIPSICRKGVGIVVSPLIALMYDQVDFLNYHNVGAAMLSSDMSQSEIKSVMEQARAGELDLLYVTPERMATQRFRDFLSEIDIALFAIDEAHLVSMWGHDFRPDYKVLSFLKSQYPGVPRVALTATADMVTQSDIMRSLDMVDAKIFKTSFDRPNISYNIAPRGKKPKDQIVEFLNRHQGETGIVYCIGRKTVEKTAEWLTSIGFNALPYHAGLDNSVRSDNQDAFIRGEVDILVATVAFGMGIDKSDIRFILHVDMPSSLEAWYQETGRAGRDGLPAETMMFFGNGDIVKRRRMIHKGGSSVPAKRTEYAKLDALIGICETVDCRRKAVLNYFGEAYSGHCGNCDVCQTPPECIDATSEAKAVVELLNATGEGYDAFDIVSYACGTVSKIKVETHGIRSAFNAIDATEERWSSIVRQMLSSGLLEVDLSKLASIAVTPMGQKVLEDDTFSVAKIGSGLTASVKKVGSKPSSRKATTASRSKSKDDSGYTAPRRRRASKATGTPLLEALRKERNRLAKELGVKRYYVVHDSALKLMSEVKPRNGTELISIKGIGPVKLERFGVNFLSIIERHAA